MKKTDTKKQLKLRAETVRALDQMDLTKAVGAAGSRQYELSCGAPSCGCGTTPQ